MAAPAPAPASTTTSKPRAFSFLTLSGVAATRVSPARRSLVTAIVAAIQPLPRARLDGHGERPRLGMIAAGCLGSPCREGRLVAGARLLAQQEAAGDGDDHGGDQGLEQA